ncbi:MAG: hypothetical protein P0Y65_05580 [Candidatus Devosia phytovorans]|uniref:Uncharacterized protein n=1 Tax=Candidatus Devosia phytovorans TaxID=3121372 RepID=A0AAJ5VWY7_9HYPH|nr:hypothetical protein [Devosia sp.]WEK05725.1 MAG: hypothetical protein P0Y65_05580 [Devosia sp.]
MTTAKEFLDRVNEVSAAVGWQAGVGAVETAGFIISCLAASPEQIDRFMAEGSELILDGTIAPENGGLTYFASNGELVSPADRRQRMGKQQ